MSRAPATPITVRVARKSIEAEGIAGFRLVAAEGTALPVFDAGSHIDVEVPGGLLRQYSLCNAPGDSASYEIGVLHDPASRGGSKAMHEAVHEGTVLQISAPRNHFALHETASRSLLLAGGIGVTPLLAMAHRLAAQGADFALHYCTRSVARTAYLDRLRDAPFADKVHVHHDDGPAERRLDLAATLGDAPAETHLYVCGPKGFLDAVRAAAAQAGWPEARVHFEYFSGVEAHTADDQGFDVAIRSSGRVIRVAAEQTVVEALAAEGIEIPVSCAQGVCGTCLTRVLEGEIDHHDLYLTPKEQAANDQFLPCCSRARSPRLVLDL